VISYPVSFVLSQDVRDDTRESSSKEENCAWEMV
jgi:hypothetical protein